jgi:hypothetical protein
MYRCDYEKLSNGFSSRAVRQREDDEAAFLALRLRTWFGCLGRSPASQGTDNSPSAVFLLQLSDKLEAHQSAIGY